MELYIGNLALGMSTYELRKFFKGFDKNATFRIKQLVSRDQEIVIGLVVIPSDRIAKKAIKRLNYKKLDGKVVLIREYHHRVANNDRRAVNWRIQHWKYRERRNSERRVQRVLRDNDDSWFAESPMKRSSI